MYWITTHPILSIVLAIGILIIAILWYPTKEDKEIMKFISDKPKK